MENVICRFYFVFTVKLVIKCERAASLYCDVHFLPNGTLVALPN